MRKDKTKHYKKMANLSIYLGMLSVILMIISIIGYCYYNGEESIDEEEFYIEQYSSKTSGFEKSLNTVLYHKGKEKWRKRDAQNNMTPFTANRRLAEARLFAIEYQEDMYKSDILLMEANILIK